MFGHNAKDKIINQLKGELVHCEDRVARLEIQNKSLSYRNEQICFEMKKMGDMKDFEISKAVYAKAREQERALYESDLKRVEAVARYNTYIEMDTKEERNHIQRLLERAIEGLSKSTQVNVQK